MHCSESWDFVSSIVSEKHPYLWRWGKVYWTIQVRAHIYSLKRSGSLCTNPEWTFMEFTFFSMPWNLPGLQPAQWGTSTVHQSPRSRGFILPYLLSCNRITKIWYNRNYKHIWKTKSIIKWKIISRYWLFDISDLKQEKCQHTDNVALAQIWYKKRVFYKRKRGSLFVQHRCNR